MHGSFPDDKQSQAERRRRCEVGHIRDLLTLKNLTLTAIDMAYGLPRGTAGNSLHEPHLAGERAIAAALGTRPHLLWRSRYHSSGIRFSPQPAENYRNGRRYAVDSEAA